MLFGVEQRGNSVDELTEYLHDMYSEETNNLSEIRSQAENEIQRSQLHNQKNFLRNHKPAKEYNVGDIVVVKNVDNTVGKNKKLIPKYKGPYVIRKQLGHDRYVITDVENYQVTQIPYNGVVDSSRIKKWLISDRDNSMDPEGNTDVNTNVNIDDKITNEMYTDYEYLDESEGANSEDNTDANVGNKLTDDMYINYESLDQQLL